MSHEEFGEHERRQNAEERKAALKEKLNIH
jgi:hypothetical protein